MEFWNCDLIFDMLCIMNIITLWMETELNLEVEGMKISYVSVFDVG